MTMTRSTLTIGCLGALAAALMAACSGSERSTGPALVAESSSSSSLRAASGARREDTVMTLKRLTPLSAAVSVQGVIGPAGGELAVPGSGGSIVIPAGALGQPTLITMTALAGPDVAYDFQPHLRFAVPARMYQELAGTAAALHPRADGRLGGAYYEGDLASNFVDQLRSRAKVKELRHGSVDPRNRVLSFTVDHFSGYLASSGRAPTLPVQE